MQLQQQQVPLTDSSSHIEDISSPSPDVPSTNPSDPATTVPMHHTSPPPSLSTPTAYSHSPPRFQSLAGLQYPSQAPISPIPEVPSHQSSDGTTATTTTGTTTSSSSISMTSIPPPLSIDPHNMHAAQIASQQAQIAALQAQIDEANKARQRQDALLTTLQMAPPQTASKTSVPVGPTTTTPATMIPIANGVLAPLSLTPSGPLVSSHDPDAVTKLTAILLQQVLSPSNLHVSHGVAHGHRTGGHGLTPMAQAALMGSGTPLPPLSDRGHKRLPSTDMTTPNGGTGADWSHSRKKKKQVGWSGGVATPTGPPSLVTRPLLLPGDPETRSLSADLVLAATRSEAALAKHVQRAAQRQLAEAQRLAAIEEQERQERDRRNADFQKRLLAQRRAKARLEARMESNKAAAVTKQLAEVESHLTRARERAEALDDKIATRSRRASLNDNVPSHGLSAAAAVHVPISIPAPTPVPVTVAPIATMVPNATGSGYQVHPHVISHNPYLDAMLATPSVTLPNVDHSHHHRRRSRSRHRSRRSKSRTRSRRRSPSHSRSRSRSPSLSASPSLSPSNSSQPRTAARTPSVVARELARGSKLGPTDGPSNFMKFSGGGKRNILGTFGSFETDEQFEQAIKNKRKYDKPSLPSKSLAPSKRPTRSSSTGPAMRTGAHAQSSHAGRNRSRSSVASRRSESNRRRRRRRRQPIEEEEEESTDDDRHNSADENDDEDDYGDDSFDVSTSSPLTTLVPGDEIDWEHGAGAVALRQATEYLTAERAKARQLDKADADKAENVRARVSQADVEVGRSRQASKHSLRSSPPSSSSSRRSLSAESSSPRRRRHHDRHRRSTSQARRELAPSEREMERIRSTSTESSRTNATKSHKKMKQQTPFSPSPSPPPPPSQLSPAPSSSSSKKSKPRQQRRAPAIASPEPPPKFVRPSIVDEQQVSSMTKKKKPRGPPPPPPLKPTVSSLKKASQKPEAAKSSPASNKAPKKKSSTRSESSPPPPPPPHSSSNVQSLNAMLSPAPAQSPMESTSSTSPPSIPSASTAPQLVRQESTEYRIVNADGTEEITTTTKRIIRNNATSPYGAVAAMSTPVLTHKLETIIDSPPMNNHTRHLHQQDQPSSASNAELSVEAPPIEQPYFEPEPALVPELESQPYNHQHEDGQQPRDTPSSPPAQFDGAPLEPFSLDSHHRHQIDEIAPTHEAVHGATLNNSPSHDDYSDDDDHDETAPSTVGFAPLESGSVSPSCSPLLDPDTSHSSPRSREFNSTTKSLPLLSGQRGKLWSAGPAPPSRKRTDIVKPELWNNHATNATVSQLLKQSNISEEERQRLLDEFSAKKRAQATLLTEATNEQRASISAKRTRRHPHESPSLTATTAQSHTHGRTKSKSSIMVGLGVDAIPIGSIATELISSHHHQRAPSSSRIPSQPLTSTSSRPSGSPSKGATRSGIPVPKPKSAMLKNIPIVATSSSSASSSVGSTSSSKYETFEEKTSSPDFHTISPPTPPSITPTPANISNDAQFIGDTKNHSPSEDEKDEDKNEYEDEEFDIL